MNSNPEEALRESEERYRTLVDSIDQGFCVVELIFDERERPVDYRFLQVSPSFEKHTGLRDAQGKTMRELVPQLEQWWFETYGDIALTGAAKRFQNRAEHLNRWFDVYAFRIGEASRRQVAILFNDITDRKLSDDKLRESEERFRNLADNIPQLAWIADAGTDGEVHWFNKTWLDYTGATIEDMKGSGWRAVHHPDHADRVIQKFGRHVQEGMDWEDTFPLRGKDGQYRWFLSRMKVIRDEGGKVVRIFGTNTDVTEERQTAEQLRRLTAELSDLDRRKNEFLATLAHELRNPLAPIRNGLQILRLAGDNAAAAEQARTMMERQLEQMARLIDDLMDVSRINQGKIELKRERVELAKVVEGAVETSRPLIEENGHELTVTLPPGPVFVDGDPTRLTQVLLNLLNNAAKYTARGGRIDLRAELTSPERERPAEVVVSVRDAGIGIPVDKLPTIFEMFSQVEGALARSQGGLGIGLCLVKRLVEMHGGQIEAHSAGPGTGSEFVVRLPIVVEQAQARNIGDDDTRSPRADLRILVVDDNRDTASSSAMLLKMMGNDVRTAHDGEAAVRVAEEFRPQVVLCDIGLPKMNGYEACRHIRRQPWGKNMILVAVTGWGQDDDKRKAEEAGFDRHLVKPVDPQALMTLLAGLNVAKA